MYELVVETLGGLRQVRKVRIVSSLLVSLFFISCSTQFAVADSLSIAPEHTTGYMRSYFKLWVDADKNGCNTRAEVLISEAIVKPKIGKNCTLTGGSWMSPYDNKFTSKASDLDIDHLVPLAEAWRSGAWKWTSAQRQAYANDLSESRALVAVSLSQNRAKGDKDVSSWLPSKNVCTYITNWLAIKYRYYLTIDTAESAVLNQYISSCGISNINVEILSEFSVYAENPNATSTPSVSPIPTPSASKTVSAIVKMPALPKPVISEVTNSSFEIRIGDIQGWDFSVMKLVVQITGTGAGDCSKEIQVSALPTVIKCSGVLANKVWIIGLRGNGEYGKVDPTQTFSDSVTLSSYPSSTTSTTSGSSSTTPAPLPSASPSASSSSTPTPISSPSPTSSSISWPAGATARCKDGTFSTSTSRSGTCSGHGGVDVWK
jgi:hypothetical protein